MTPAQRDKFNAPLDSKYLRPPIKRQAPDRVPVSKPRPSHRDP